MAIVQIKGEPGTELRSPQHRMFLPHAVRQGCSMARALTMPCDFFAPLLQTSSLTSSSKAMAPSSTPAGSPSSHFFFPQLHTSPRQAAKNGKFFFAASSVTLRKPLNGLYPPHTPVFCLVTLCWISFHQN